jgi:hypothetical protein
MKCIERNINQLSGNSGELEKENVISINSKKEEKEKEKRRKRIKKICEYADTLKW